MFSGLESEKETMARLEKRDERVQRWFWRFARKPPVPSASVEETLKQSFLQDHREPGAFPSSVLFLVEESPATEAMTVPPLDELDTYPSLVSTRSQETPAGGPSLDELDTYPSLPPVEEVEERPLPTVQFPGKEGAGSGQFERGECDVAVAHPPVTAASVVVVVLTGHPGPVVVQYVSLDPGRGFTVHLSAPVEHTTPFNYAML
jgi:hypothetical protein